MSMAPSQLGAFTKSRPGLAHPNLDYHVQPLSLDKFGEPLHSFPAFTASVCNLRPESRGHVRISGPDPGAKPSEPLRERLECCEGGNTGRRAIWPCRAEVLKPSHGRPFSSRPGSSGGRPYRVFGRKRKRLRAIREGSASDLVPPPERP